MDRYSYLEYTVLLDECTLARLGNLHFLLHIFKTESRKRLSSFWCRCQGTLGCMSNPSYYYLPHVFPCNAIGRLCWTSSNGTELTHQSPSMVIDHNHALTPSQCDVPVHLHNASLHVISCHMYNECYMDNSNHTIHHVLWTIISKTYNFQIKLISMSIYINTHISTFNYP